MTQSRIRLSDFAELVWMRRESEVAIGVIEIHLPSNPQWGQQPHFTSLNRDSSAADCLISLRFSAKFFDDHMTAHALQESMLKVEASKVKVTW